MRSAPVDRSSTDAEFLILRDHHSRAKGQSNPELLQAFLDRYFEPRRQEARRTLEDRIVRGELPLDLDVDLTLDALYGPIYTRFLVGHDALTDTLASEIWDIVFNGSGKHQ